MNAFLFILLLASALYFFVSVTVYDMAALGFRNDWHPIEGTDLYIRDFVKKTKDESGIYDGDQEWSAKLVPGDFGYDWGAHAEGDTLYINEYHSTRFGFLLCDLVRIDLKTYEKETVYRNTMMTGLSRSGELVCMGETVGANWFPGTNPLYRLYSMTAGGLMQDEGSAVVRMIDPVSGKTVFEKRDENALSAERQEYYLASTLEEVMG